MVDLQGHAHLAPLLVRLQQGTPSRSVGREKREQGRGMGAWRSRQGERPAYLRNTNFLCSAKYEPWGVVGVPDWSLRGNNDAELGPLRPEDVGVVVRDDSEIVLLALLQH